MELYGPWIHANPGNHSCLSWSMDPRGNISTVIYANQGKQISADGFSIIHVSSATHSMNSEDSQTPPLLSLETFIANPTKESLSPSINGEGTKGVEQLWSSQE